ETYRGASWLQEPEARTLLRSWGIAVPDWVVAASADDCADAAQKFGRPVVLKLIAQGALHKSDIGGVLLNVEGRSGAADAYRELLARARAAALTDVRVLVTPMIRGSAEIVVGAVRDGQFGPAVMVGMGGVLVELLDDVSFRLAPVSQPEAAEMLDELKGARLFRGYRGADPLDIQAIPALLTRLSVMMARCPEIREVDVNPIIVSKDGAFVADARVVLDPAAGFSVEC
ncbi:acetate--CoA ligase family protein, partial [Vineibacter terrae]|uniref:acetate--CoA ligase family protein n=1 Tax=Vineibacter terrae TaxID=2586908 RepID=UPI002E304B2A